MPTHNRLQRVPGVNGHPGHELDLTAPTVVPPPNSSSSSTPPTNSDRSPEPPLPSSSYSSSSSSSSSSFVASAMLINTTHNPDTPTNTNTTTVDTSGEKLAYTCTHFDRTFTSHIGLVGDVRIHRTETGEPVPGAPTYTHRIHLPCP
nr:unnamed protein product [Spirometra erinaceieuropaei]